MDVKTDCVNLRTQDTNMDVKTDCVNLRNPGYKHGR